jgi:hypothetical protein
LPEFALDYQSSDALAMEVKFNSDWWEENIV